ncbi:MAG TPA: DUF1656 domain-containing protein [Aliidongia sp.]|uniref:DUF1656 domain-containing protein n=1 Tax=Aliidongia sp. TaxID=1914230 RepID=UPI002DDDBB3D|nr:DUF1656 domain-containing protein [Aliidongia sp.]HEV2675008.1 DUF1656 domain-containing protein [Aliidongia sp.]
MIAEINVAGVYLAPIALYAMIAIPIFVVLRVILARLGFWHAIWHPALFEAALYLSILSLLVLL